MAGTQAAPILKLLVCSLGNPAPYANTLHSTGHLILSSIQKNNSHLFGPFTKSKDYGNGLISRPFSPITPITLWQSTSPMNSSGISVIAAYKSFLRHDIEGRGQFSKGREEGLETSRLIVVHDELELGLGEVKVRKGSVSAKGHNGLKSVKSRWEEAGRGRRNELGRWWRVGVGIGRPESREKGDVARYVLRSIGGEERRVLEGAGEGAWGEILKIVEMGEKG